jgi:CDP-6-deoxy-D-xylo-4-hexulose-3-dehydrase
MPQKTQLDHSLLWKRWQGPGDPHLINRIQWDRAEIEEIERVFHEDWFGYGKINLELEERLAERFGTAHVTLTNSGSAAILVAVKSLLASGRLQRGDLIIHPVTTFPTSIASAIDLGLVPVFVETRRDTCVIDPDEVAGAIDRYPQIKGAIIPHLIGNISDMEKVKSALDGRILIEDSCDTIGTTFAGRHAGSWGDLTAYSFYGSHHITSGGIGGALTTNDPELQQVARSITCWGRDLSAGDDPLDRYTYATIGTNSQMGSLQAAFALRQLDRLPQFIEARARQFAEMKELLARYSYLRLPRSHPQAEPSWFAFPLIIAEDAPLSRRDLADRLVAQRIDLRPIMCGNILRQPPFQQVPHTCLHQHYPIGDEIQERGILIPCWGMPNDQKHDYHDILRKILDEP